MTLPVDSNIATPPVNPGATAAAAPAKPVGPAPGTPEYDAAMVAKFDAHQAKASGDVPAPADNQTVATRPDHIPEKFWDAAKGEVNVEAMAKSYAELEKGRAPKVGETIPVKADEAKPAEGEAAKVAESAGLDMEALQAEYAEKQDLSPESKAALAKVGISDEVLQSYIRGQEALMAQRDSALLAVVGGEESYGKIATWAQTHLNEAEKTAFNNALAGSTEQATLAMGGLKARYEGAVGKEPTLLGGVQGAGAGQGFQSQAEMTKAMRDPRYQNDPAYRKQVEQKLESATFWQ